MDDWLKTALTVVGAVLASSGFWAYIMKRIDKKDVKTQMLLGLGHDRIVFLCQSYLDRGWITTEEYENLHDYLYVPYAKMHGNGTGKKMMAMVDKLPIKNVQKEIVLPKCQDS